MAKYYIGGVANVTAFNGVERIFDAKTLTDSSINISVSAEEIRGGEGAQLLGKFFHTTVFNLSLTDALFDFNYLAQQVGSEINEGEGVEFRKQTVKNGEAFEIKDGEKTLEVASITGDGNMYGWDEKNNHYLIGTSGNKYVITSGLPADGACLSIPVQREGKAITVNAQYYPSTMKLIMEAKLFAGDACKVSGGKPVGKIVIEIPRFQLDGTIDLAMAMASPATFAMNGSALASGCECNMDPYYAKITQIIFDEEVTPVPADKYAGYDAIIADGSSLAIGDKLRIYAVGEKKIPAEMSMGEFTIQQSASTPVINQEDGLILAAGTATLTVKSDVEVLKGEKVIVTTTNS